MATEHAQVSESGGYIDDFTDAEHEVFLQVDRSPGSCMMHHNGTFSFIDYGRILPRMDSVYKRVGKKGKRTYSFNPPIGIEETIARESHRWRNRLVCPMEQVTQSEVTPRLNQHAWVDWDSQRPCYRPTPAAHSDAPKKDGKTPTAPKGSNAAVSPIKKDSCPTQATHRKCKAATGPPRKCEPREGLRERIVPSSKLLASGKATGGLFSSRIQPGEKPSSNQSTAEQTRVTGPPKISPRKRKSLEVCQDEGAPPRKCLKLNFRACRPANIEPAIIKPVDRSSSGTLEEESDTTETATTPSKICPKSSATSKKSPSKPAGSPSYAVMAGMAIQSAPNQQKHLSEIYAWMQETFPLLSQIPNWQNNVRHDLSSTYGSQAIKRFRQEPRSLTSDKKGDLWRLEDRDDNKVRVLKRDVAEGLAKLGRGELKHASNYRGPA